jgi:hypothetical protein
MLALKKIVLLPLLVLLLVAAGCTGATPVVELPATLPALPPAAVLEAQRTLSEALGIAVTEIELVTTEQVDWPDACLGLPSGGEACAEVITPGWQVVLRVNGQDYVYRTSSDGLIVRPADVLVSPYPGIDPTPAAAETGGAAQPFQIYLIAIGDAGQAGPEIGCGDSLVPAEQALPLEVQEPRAALERLLAIKDQFYGQSGLYNALYQSDLQVEDVKIDSDGLVTVYLTGQVMLGGECDSPRFQAQLEQTIKQFPTVQQVEIYINDQLMQEALSSQG